MTDFDFTIRTLTKNYRTEGKYLKFKMACIFRRADAQHCPFNVKYGLNSLSGYYCLEDFDPLHNHPV